MGWFSVMKTMCVCWRGGGRVREGILKIHHRGWDLTFHSSDALLTDSSKYTAESTLLKVKRRHLNKNKD